MKKKILIVGAGLAGCTCARLLAEIGHSITLIDKCSDLGGICRDIKLEENNCYYHLYGPHCFHTKKEYIWDFVNRFSKFREWHLQQMAYRDGKFYNFPINLNTIEQVYNTDVNSKEDVDALIHNKFYPYPNNFEEYAINDVGTKLYEMFFKEYTEKQWQCSCDKLPSSIYKRVGIRYNRDNDLFQNQYQGVPEDGYSGFLFNMIQHNNIDFIPLAEYNPDDTYIDHKYDVVIYTGGFEGLPYRSTAFVKGVDRLNSKHPLVSLSDDETYTRRTNYSTFHPIDPNKKNDVDVCMYEHPLPNNSDPILLPINTLENNMLYLIKREEFKKLHPKAILIGRLASYKYFNMDDTIDNCFKTLTSEGLIHLSVYFK